MEREKLLNLMETLVDELSQRDKNSKEGIGSKTAGTPKKKGTRKNAGKQKAKSKFNAQNGKRRARKVASKRNTPPAKKADNANDKKKKAKTLPSPRFAQDRGVWITDASPSNVNKYWIANDNYRTVDAFKVAEIILSGLSDAQPELCRLSKVRQYCSEKDIILANLELDEYWGRFCTNPLSLTTVILKAYSSAAISKVTTQASEDTALGASQSSFYSSDDKLSEIEEWIFTLDDKTDDFPDFWGQLNNLSDMVGHDMQVSASVQRVVFNTARDIVTTMLGEVPTDAEICSYSKHGPGSTQTMTSDFTSTFYKDTDLSAYEHSLDRLSSILAYEQHMWEFAGYDIRRMGGLNEQTLLPMVVGDIKKILTPYAMTRPDRVIFVGKNWKALRPILPGATLNVYVQLGVGSIMETRMQPFGIDIRDQERNKLLARRGSASGRFATFDLTNASGLISAEHVRRVVSTDWFSLLDDLRSRAIEREVDGEVISYYPSFFSGMGNGYTFPLETAIFVGALGAACYLAGRPPEYCFELLRTKQAAVYGDDIIVPTWLSPFMANALYLMGFKVNTEKSFVDGPFRESCGGDYYLGINVRPPFIRCCEPGRVGAESLIALHNGYMASYNEVLPDGTSIGQLIGARDICKSLRDLWRTHIHPVIPTSNDGRGFLMEGHTPYCTRGIVGSYQRWGTFNTYVDIQRKKVLCFDPHLAFRAHMAGAGATNVQDILALSLRGKYRVKLNYDREYVGSRHPYIVKVIDLLRQVKLRKQLGVL